MMLCHRQWFPSATGEQWGSELRVGSGGGCQDRAALGKMNGSTPLLCSASGTCWKCEADRYAGWRVAWELERKHALVEGFAGISHY